MIRGILQAHDLLLSVGGDLFTLSLPGLVDAVPEGLAIVHLDTDPWEIGKNYPVKVGILGDPKATLPELMAAVQAGMTAGARARAAERLAEAKAEGEAGLTKLRAQAEAASARTPIQPLALMRRRRGDAAGGRGGDRRERVLRRRVAPAPAKR